MKKVILFLCVIVLPAVLLTSCSRPIPKLASVYMVGVGVSS